MLYPKNNWTSILQRNTHAHQRTKNITRDIQLSCEFRDNLGL